MWVLIIGSRPLTSWFEPSQINSLDALVEGSPLDRTLLLLLIFGGVIVLISRGFDWLRFGAANKWIVVYFAYLGVGIFWSDYTFIAFKRWIKDLGNLVMVLIVLSEANPQAAIKTLLLRASYVLVPISVVLVKYFPDIARSYDFWTGRVYFSAVAITKNMLGMTLTVLALAHLWSLMDAFKERRSRSKSLEIFVHIVLLMMIAWLLNLADSATALASIAVGAMIMVLLRAKGVRARIKLWATLALLAGGIFAIPDIRFAIMEPIVGILGRDITLTDRDDLWRVLLQQDVNPLIGDGSYSFWMGERVERPLPGLDGWANSAHNAYLEIYLNVGLVGVALYLAILASGVRRELSDISRGGHDQGESFRLSFLIVTVLYGVTEAVVRLDLIWFGLLLVLVRSHYAGLLDPPGAQNVSPQHKSSTSSTIARPAARFVPRRTNAKTAHYRTERIR